VVAALKNGESRDDGVEYIDTSDFIHHTGNYTREQADSSASQLY
jgi:hypothetical protein